MSQQINSQVILPSHQYQPRMLVPTAQKDVFMVYLPSSPMMAQPPIQDVFVPKAQNSPSIVIDGKEQPKVETTTTTSIQKTEENNNKEEERQVAQPQPMVMQAVPKKPKSKAQQMWDNTPGWVKAIGGTALVATVALVGDHFLFNGAGRKWLTNKGKPEKLSKTTDLDNYTNSYYKDVKNQIERQKEIIQQKMKGLDPKKDAKQIAKLRTKLEIFDENLESLDLNYKRYSTKNALTMIKGQFSTDYENFAKQVAERVEANPNFKIEDDKDLLKQFAKLQKTNEKITQMKADYAPIKKAAKEKDWALGGFATQRLAYEIEIKNRMVDGSLTEIDKNYIRNAGQRSIFNGFAIDDSTNQLVRRKPMPTMKEELVSDAKQIATDYKKYTTKTKPLFEIGVDDTSKLKKILKLDKKNAESLNDARWARATGLVYNQKNASDIAQIIRNDEGTFLDIMNSSPFGPKISNVDIKKESGWTKFWHGNLGKSGRSEIPVFQFEGEEGNKFHRFKSGKTKKQFIKTIQDAFFSDK